MNQLDEVRLAGGVDKKHKFEDADVGKVASHNTGFTHIGVVQGHDVYHRPRLGKSHDFVMTKEGDRKIHTHLNTFQTKGGAHHENFLQSKAGSGPGVHHLYHHLVTKHGIVMTGNNQSEGGAAVWRKLSKMRGVHVHAVDAKGRGHHVDLSDLRDTHVNPIDIDNAKTSARAKRLKSILAMRLVAHKS
jgi:hypothetical protein